MSKLLSKAAILAAVDRKTEDVEVPEWGGAVRLRTISGSERDQFEASVRSANGKMNLSNVRARLVSLAAVDEKGERMFSNGDVAALGEKSAVALDRVFDVAMQLAGMRPEDVDELTENFPNGQSDDSTLD